PGPQCRTPFPYTTLFRPRHRAAHREPEADTAGDLERVLLELHPRPAAVAELAPGEVGLDLCRGDRDTGGEAFEDRHQFGSVRLPDRKSTRLNSSHVKISY